MCISGWSSDVFSSDLPQAVPPPLQGEGRGGDGFPVGRGVVQPRFGRGETHPHPNPPLEGEGFKAAEGFEAMHAPGHAATWAVDSAMRTLHALAAAEDNPALVPLKAPAQAQCPL